MSIFYLSSQVFHTSARGLFEAEGDIFCILGLGNTIGSCLGYNRETHRLAAYIWQTSERQAQRGFAIWFHKAGNCRLRQNSERPFSSCGFAIWVCTCSVQTETVEKVAKNSFHFVHFVSHRLQLCESSATANLPSDFSRRENGPISNPLFCVTKCPHVWELPLCQSRLTRL